MPALGAEPFAAIFIRAPFIELAGDGVEILGRLEDGTAVAVRQGRLLAIAFHPELGGDTRMHRYFLGIVAESPCKSAEKTAIPAD